MYKIGTVCMKIAGRDAGRLCVIIEEAKDGLVLVDGDVRRKSVNLRHLEPTGKTVKVKKSAGHEEVMKALGLEPKKSSARKPAERPKAKRTAGKSSAEKSDASKKSKKKAAASKKPGKGTGKDSGAESSKPAAAAKEEGQDSPDEK